MILMIVTVPGAWAQASCASNGQGLPEPDPTRATVVNTAVVSNPLVKLRVAHGLALGGYIGASIELTVDAIPAGNWQPWLLLLETIPAGMEGTPVTRNLVRNVLIPSWQIADVDWPHSHGYTTEQK